MPATKSAGWVLAGLLLGAGAFVGGRVLSYHAPPAPRPLPNTLTVPRSNPTIKPSAGSSQWGSGPAGAGLTPAQVASLYQVSALWHDGAQGQNQPIALIEFTGVASSDIARFTASYHYPPLRLHRETLGLPDTAPGLEATLDVEWVHALAPRSPIWLFDTASPDDLAAAIDQGLMQGIRIFSLSFATLAPDAYPGGGLAINRVLQQAADEGAAVFVSAGDWGPYGLESTSAAQYTVNFPASSPWVVAVGGTALTATGHQVAWRYGGGGQSPEFAAPRWQRGIVPNGQRWVPDVAFLAGSPGVSVYWQHQWVSVEGTSIGAPGWAALWADLRSALEKHPPGFPSPLLYQAYAADAPAFTEIDQGSNGVYSAHAGWNAVTGLGTPLALNLLHWLRRHP